MQVEELVGFIKWFDNEVRVSNLVKLYQQLYNILNQNTQPSVQKAPFESQKDALIKAVLRVKLDALNDAQLGFAEHLGLTELVGERAKENIEDVLFKNVIDMATAAKKINDFQNSLNTLLAKMAKVWEGLSPYVEEFPADYKEALIHIHFQRDASINNIVDLKKWGDGWYDIGRGIALANKLPPEDIRVIGASRGSLIYDLAVTYAIASTLTSIILLVLKVADRVLDLRKKAEELRGMKLSNDKAAQELDKEAEKENEDGQAEVLTTIKAGTKLDGEQETALAKAINKIFEFISGGGVIDVHIKEKAKEGGEEPEHDQSKNQKTIAEIKKSFTEIKRLEAKILLLTENNP